MIKYISTDHKLFVDQNSYSAATPLEQVAFIQQQSKPEVQVVFKQNLKTAYTSFHSAMVSLQTDPSLTLAVLAHMGAQEQILEDVSRAMSSLNDFFSNQKQPANFLEEFGVTPYDSVEAFFKSENIRITKTRINRSASYHPYVGDNFIMIEDFKNIFLDYINYLQNSGVDSKDYYFNYHTRSYTVSFDKDALSLGCKRVSKRVFMYTAYVLGFDGVGFNNAVLYS